MENIFSFHNEWITEKVTAYKIVVKDKALLNAATTLSIHGSFEYTNDGVKKTLPFVNQQLKAIAGRAQDYLNAPFFTDEGEQSYDFELTLFSVYI